MLAPTLSMTGLTTMGLSTLDILWAMQPITLKISNADGFADFEDSLQADHIILEDITNLDPLERSMNPF